MTPGSLGTILVVDDDDHIRAFVTEALDLEGYEVRNAPDGIAALDVLAVWRPDLILLDLNMPRMDGWTFCSVQQAAPDLADIPVALMSATHNLQAQALPCAPVAVLEKPFDLDKLLDQVAAALHERRDNRGVDEGGQSGQSGAR
ncbi:MAG: response regulator [Chloroflexi bacterium]|nr:response regulator [Chloroflexota bacterium]